MLSFNRPKWLCKTKQEITSYNSFSYVEQQAQNKCTKTDGTKESLLSLPITREKTHNNSNQLLHGSDINENGTDFQIIQKSIILHLDFFNSIMAY